MTTPSSGHGKRGPLGGNRMTPAAMVQLSPQKQKVFQLSKYDDLSHDEIAEELNLSKSNIKNHLSETMQYLRRNLKVASNSETLLQLVLIDLIKKSEHFLLK